MIRRLVGAIQFLTVIPIRSDGASIGESAIFFPLVGAMVGTLASGVYLSLDRLLPTSISAAGTLLFLVLISGGLHEDGLADAADALRSGRSAEKILGIMKDSRIGSYGGLALVFSILIRWQALAALGAHSTVALIVSETLPRTAAVVLSHASKPVGSGLGSAMGAGLSRRLALAAAVQGLVIAALLAPHVSPALLLGTAAILWVARAYFHRKIGGVTGDCLGAAMQLVEAFSLLTFVWARSI
jgi:adenosylcobinamide-GDP ribazoletransferase